MDATVLWPLALWAVGFAAARRLGRGAGAPALLAHLEAAGLAPAIGALLASTSFFFAAIVTDRGVTRSSWSLAFAAVALVFVVLTRRRKPVAEPPAPAPATPALIAATIALVLVLGTLVVAEAHALPARPHGHWDAQAIWNVRARLLVRADGDWAERFLTLDLGHPDYPLLLPGTVATLWLWSGTESVVQPQVLSTLFLVGLVLLVFTTAWRSGGPLAAALATPLVAWTPHVVLNGAAQLADVPVALFLLAAWSGLASLRLDDARGRASALAVGAALGGLAWTKNEGLVWAALLVVTWAAMEMARHRWRAVLGSLGPLLRGAALSLVAWGVFKLSWASPNDVVRDLGAGLLDDLSSWPRWRGVLDGVWRELALATGPDVLLDIARNRTQSPGTVRWAGAWLVLIAALVLGVRRRGLTGARDLAYGACSLGAILAAIVLIYVVTPRDQAWHIISSMGRLLLQVYPAIVVGVVSAVVRSRQPSVAAARLPEPLAT